jgi:hypothetical protein
MYCEICYSVVRPSASGIELIELGGITPTSVTTAVILEGGVRSYSGLRISRLCCFLRVSVSFDRVRGKEEKRSPDGAIHAILDAVRLGGSYSE